MYARNAAFSRCDAIMDHVIAQTVARKKVEPGVSDCSAEINYRAVCISWQCSNPKNPESTLAGSN